MRAQRADLQQLSPRPTIAALRCKPIVKLSIASSLGMRQKDRKQALTSEGATGGTRKLHRGLNESLTYGGHNGQGDQSREKAAANGKRVVSEVTGINENRAEQEISRRTANDLDDNNFPECESERCVTWNPRLKPLPRGNAPSPTLRVAFQRHSPVRAHTPTNAAQPVPTHRVGMPSPTLRVAPAPPVGPHTNQRSTTRSHAPRECRRPRSSRHLPPLPSRSTQQPTQHNSFLPRSRVGNAVPTLRVAPSAPPAVGRHGNQRS